MRYAVIMAGGSGTRLWPLSRRRRPKQLLPLAHGRSLLELTWERLTPLVPCDRLLVCASQDLQSAISTALPDLAPGNYLAEPVGRDTLAAAALCAAALARRDPEAILLLSSADHLIAPVAAFVAAAERAFAIAAAEPRALITFGVRPTAPATGYGYLELGAESPHGVPTVDQFREKPDLATAEAWLAAGASRYLWNSGMFVWRATTFLDCLATYAPDIAEPLHSIAAAWDTPARDAVLREVYPTLRRISLDYAIMEPVSRDGEHRVLAVPLGLDWRDIGSWPSYGATLAHDAAGNAVMDGAAVVLHDARDCLVVSEDPRHVVTLVGCSGLVVVHTADATLVCRADQAEAIKAAAARVRDEYGGAWD